jgi:hypothetical protein
MASGTSTTIFRQLIFNVIIPTLIALLVFAALNFVRTRSILASGTKEKNHLLSNEVIRILKFQDMVLKLVEEELDERLKRFSNQLVDEYFASTGDIESRDLDRIAAGIGMDTINEDICIIRRDGVVINTTFKQDFGVNLHDYGDKFRNYLLNIFHEKDLVTELFTIEAKTGRPIVRGDFYWVHETEGLFMIAAVDCTGHGVPGAFMSVVGFNQLNHAVNVRKAKSAGEILNELNTGVINTLNESRSESKIKDGMDMAMCVFDTRARVAEFAGANNPLYLIRDDILVIGIRI